MQRFIPRSPKQAAAAGGAAVRSAQATGARLFNQRSTPVGQQAAKPAATAAAAAAEPPGSAQKRFVLTGNKRLSRRSFSPIVNVPKSSISPIVKSPAVAVAAANRPVHVSNTLAAARSLMPPPTQSCRRPRTAFLLDIRSPDGNSLYTEHMQLALPRRPAPTASSPRLSTSTVVGDDSHNSSNGSSILNVSGESSSLLNASSLNSSLNASLNASLNSSALNASADGRNPHLDDNISVSTILDAVGFGKYADLFEGRKIEVAEMLAMNRAELEAIGGVSAGDVPKLAAALQRL